MLTFGIFEMHQHNQHHVDMCTQFYRFWHSAMLTCIVIIIMPICAVILNLIITIVTSIVVTIVIIAISTTNGAVFPELSSLHRLT